ncbi:MAG TPA: hypothetical protein VF587_04310 [Solirubrobacteraceae bacterium]
MHGRHLLPLACGLIGLALPSSASAADRWASPSGSGTECSQANPCSITTAYSGAQEGSDGVPLTAGTFTLTSDLVLDKNIVVRGVDAGSTTLTGTAADAGPGLLTVSAGVLSDVTIDQVPPGACAGSDRTVVRQLGGTLERVHVSYPGSCDGVGISLVGGTVTDSLVDMGEGVGISAGSTPAPTIRNVTVRAPGDLALAHSAPLNVTNSIFDGEIDVRSVVFDPADFLNLTYSNFGDFESDTDGPGGFVTPGGDQTTGNQRSAAPLLNANGTQQAGSPTIDAGTNAIPLDALDLFEGLRILGTPRTDIGADELDDPGGPGVEPPALGTIRAANFDLTARALANGYDTTVKIQIDDEDTFSTPLVDEETLSPTTGPGNGRQYDGVTVGGSLSPATQYYVRVLAENSQDDVSSDGVSLTTLSEPAVASVTVASPTTDRTPSVTAAPNRAGVTLQCRFDSAAFEACGAGPWSPGTNLADGSHELEVKPSDGSMDGVSAVRTVVIGTTGGGGGDGDGDGDGDGGGTTPPPGDQPPVTPPPGVTPTIPPVLPPASTAAVAISRVRVQRGRTLLVTVRNPNAAAAQVRAVLRAGGKVAGRRAATIPANATGRIRVALSRALRKRLRRGGRAKAVLKLTTSGAAPVTQRLTLRR